jgi:hypothetical protein
MRGLGRPRTSSWPGRGSRGLEPATDSCQAMITAGVRNAELHLYGNGHHPGDPTPDERPLPASPNVAGQDLRDLVVSGVPGGAGHEPRAVGHQRSERIPHRRLANHPPGRSPGADPTALIQCRQRLTFELDWASWSSCRGQHRSLWQTTRRWPDPRRPLHRPRPRPGTDRGLAATPHSEPDLTPRTSLRAEQCACAPRFQRTPFPHLK